MKILAMDTSAKAASVAITDGETPLAVYSLEAGRTHSETVLPMVESALKVAHLTLDDINLFAVTNGPGSFTGVRIGISTVKGLAFGTGKPCVGVSTLLALAYNLKDVRDDCFLCPVMDARRNQLYNALFDYRNGEFHRLCEDRLIAMSDLQKELDALDKPIYGVGDGYDLLAGNFPELKVTPILLRPQNAYSVALCALSEYEKTADKNGFTDTVLLPKYLRASQAERELAEKEKGE
ncbi:MAG: tRNA (adenosine(37)-N6)-threonylcarbamoyltransferase complex dimerization subunit type 1 TsaB [Ruminococcus sp.]|nr:tRNA (adenosine(37)-N6)-threonylcarbamoyltransferase complex dimerization subunit type 1 TsaB [Candidatus Apopatosoma intestinale]